MKRSILALALLTSGCTVVGGLAGAGITKAHNSSVEPESEWSYVGPVVTGALVGLIVDILLWRSIGEGLGSLAKQ